MVEIVAFPVTDDMRVRQIALELARHTRPLTIRNALKRLDRELIIEGQVSLGLSRGLAIHRADVMIAAIIKRSDHLRTASTPDNRRNVVGVVDA